MLRYTFLAGFLLFNANTVLSQVFLVEDWDKKIHVYRQHHFPQWAKTFADSAMKKVLVEPRPAGFLDATPGEAPRNLPPNVRPIDYIGRDGLPGDPLPAVHFPRIPFDIKWEELREQFIEGAPRKKLLDLLDQELK